MTRSIGSGSTSTSSDGGTSYASDHLQRPIGDVKHPVGVFVRSSDNAGLYWLDPRSGQAQNLGGYSGAMYASFLFDGSLRAFYSNNGLIYPTGTGSSVSQSDGIDLSGNGFTTVTSLRATDEKLYLLLQNGDYDVQYRVADVDTGSQLFKTETFAQTNNYAGEMFASEAGRFFIMTGSGLSAFDDSDGSTVSSYSTLYNGGFVAFPDGSVMAASNGNTELAFFSPDLSTGPDWTVPYSDLTGSSLGHESIGSVEGMTAIDRNRVFISQGDGGPPFVVDQNGDVVLRHLTPPALPNVANVSKSPLGTVLVTNYGGGGYTVHSYPTDAADYGTELFSGNGEPTHFEAGPTVGQDPAAHGL